MMRTMDSVTVMRRETLEATGTRVGRYDVLQLLNENRLTT